MNFMGRLKKYITAEEQIAARKKRQMNYYSRNKESINSKNLARYHNFILLNNNSGSI